MKKTKFTHGGARTGAGRKPLVRGQYRNRMLRIRITEAEDRMLKAEGKRRGVTVSDLLMRPWRKGV
jgi:hypothetical protein